MVDPNPAVPTRRIGRFWWLLAMGGVSVAAALAYLYYWVARPIGSGPAGPAVPRDAFTRVWTARPVLLLGVGDSITAGFGASPGHSYFDRLRANPQDEFDDMKGICLGTVLPNLEARNLAVSGSTSIDHVAILRDKLDTEPTETLGLVVMTSGGNGIIHNYGRTAPREGAMYGASLTQARPWIDAFERRLAEMIDILNERFPGGCHTFLADIYDPTDAVGDAEHAGLPRWPDGLAVHRAYNDLIRRCGDRPNVHIVPVYSEFLGHGIHCTQFWRTDYRRSDPHYWYADNLEDPNDRGYDAIRRLFLIEMSKVVGQLAD